MRLKYIHAGAYCDYGQSHFLTSTKSLGERSSMTSKRIGQLLLASLLIFSRTAAEVVDLPQSHSVEPQLHATGFEFAEGPTFNSEGDLFVVNYRTKGMIGRIRRDGTAGVFVDLNKLSPVPGQKSQANGLKVDRDGNLLAADAGAPRLLRIARDGTKIEVLADQYDGEPFRGVNDVCLDLAGNIYFTDPTGSGKANPIGCVYRYDMASKKVTRLAKDLAFPNGVAVTPDQKHLCFAESQEFRVWILDLVSGGGAKVLIDFPQSDAGEFRGGPAEPDGMVFDEFGRLYVAMYGGGVVNVIDVGGKKLIRQYDAGGKNATNCHFYGKDLYVTAADKEAVFRIPLGVHGFDYNARPK